MKLQKTLLVLLSIVLFSCSSKTFKVGQIKTEKGEILIWLHNETPNHKKSFIELANKGYWDSYTFNRVIPKFVVQGGCPDTPEGFNAPEYLLKHEIKEELKHIYGAVGAGRDANPDKNSARCQFYIVQNKKGLPRLDGDYTIFGQVFKGMEIVDEIVNVKRDSLDQPLQSISLDVNIIDFPESKLKKMYPDYSK